MEAKLERQEWIEKHGWAAVNAARLLTAAKKQRVSEYDERLRKLRDFSEVLAVKQIDKQDELFAINDILTPELRDLIDKPLQGLC